MCKDMVWMMRSFLAAFVITTVLIIFSIIDIWFIPGANGYRTSLPYIDWLVYMIIADVVGLIALFIGSHLNCQHK